MAQNTYIYLQLDEVSGSIVRDLERRIRWSKQEQKLSCERRRAFVAYGWALLKAHCWTHAEHVLDAADVDEVAKTEGFSDALLAAGYAELEKRSDNGEASRDERKIKIERFSHENITNKNKLCNDNQRKRNKRLTEREGETSAKNRTHVREKSDAYPHAPIDKIPYNTPSPTYNTRQYNNGYNNSSSYYRYDRGNGNNQDRQISLYSTPPEDRDESQRARSEQNDALITAKENSDFKEWLSAEHPTIRVESLSNSEAGLARIKELVEEWKTNTLPKAPEDDDIGF